MSAKLDPMAAAPALMKDWYRTSLAINNSLDPTLAELVKIRASQLNGCANCLNLHTTAARERGETDQRLHLLAAWPDAPCYTPAERAALAWTDALTRLSQGHAPLPAAYDALVPHFSETQRVQLTLLINVINGWNRLAVAFHLWADPATIKSATAHLNT